MTFCEVAENKSFVRKSGNFIKNSPNNSIFKVWGGIFSNFGGINVRKQIGSILITFFTL